MKTHLLGLTAAALLAGAAVLARAPADDAATADEKLLKDAGAAVDGDGLLAFLRKRTPTEAERKEVEALIRRLGDEDFDEREAASRRLRERGEAAAPFLKAALNNPDAEVARRARQCLSDLGPAAGPALPAAAVRLLARQAPAGAAAALLDYLPFARDATVEEEVFDALLALTPEAGQADAALVSALRAPSALRRAAAAHALGRKGDKEQRAAVRDLLADKDAAVRWRAALALLAARDKEAVPAVIGLVGDGPADLAWQADDVLQRLAGDKAPEGTLGDAAEARGRRHDQWAAWWKANADGVDLARFNEADRLLGYTLIVEYNTNRVWECTADGTVRWEFRNLRGPMDAQALPNGLILLAESGARVVSERDTKGNVKWEKKLDVEPNGVRRLRNGNTFISSYGGVLELAPDGSTVYEFKLESGSNAIRKHANGHVIYTAEAEVVEVDTAGKRVRSVPLPKGGTYVGLQDLPGDRFLAANSGNGKVFEVDATGKVLWEGTVPGACGVERLPGGNTLVTANRKVVELDRDGKAVWEQNAEGYARRVHRR
jgi:HEAT repeat protein